MGWWTRKAIALATITLTISEYVEKDVTHVDIQQVATGGISGTTENRTLDWTYRDHKDGIFGSVKGKSRWVKLVDVDDDEFLKTGWDDMEGDHIQSYVESNGNGWTADQVGEILCCGAAAICVSRELMFRVGQVWGFEVLDQKRRYVRHVVVRKGDDWKQARLVYDYQGYVFAFLL